MGKRSQSIAQQSGSQLHPVGGLHGLQRRGSARPMEPHLMAGHSLALAGVSGASIVCPVGNLAAWPVAGSEARGHDRFVLLRIQEELSDGRANCGRDVSSDRRWLDDLASDGIPPNSNDRLLDHRIEAPSCIETPRRYHA